MAKQKRPRQAAQPPLERAPRRAPLGLAIAAGLIVVAAAAAWWILRPAPRPHPNLLLITIDTLRADHVGVYGATTGATPALDALAARGVRFDQVQTAVPLTAPSHATILTGQYPPVHGVRGNVVFTLGTKDPTLATLLKRHGYRTAALDATTVIVVLADHGEGLGDHYEQTHGVLIYQSTMRVPMIVAGPGVPAAGAVTTRVATIDVLPTAMRLLGFDYDTRLFGRDLRPLMNEKPIADESLYAE